MEYKFSIEKYIYFLSENNEHDKKEMGKNIYIQISLKCLGIKLANELKPSKQKTAKYWRKKLNKSLEDGKASLAPGLMELIYRFNVTPSKFFNYILKKKTLLGERVWSTFQDRGSSVRIFWIGFQLPGK